MDTNTKKTNVATQGSKFLIESQRCSKSEICFSHLLSLYLSGKKKKKRTIKKTGSFLVSFRSPVPRVSKTSSLEDPKASPDLNGLFQHIDSTKGSPITFSLEIWQSLKLQFDFSLRIPLTLHCKNLSIADLFKMQVCLKCRPQILTCIYYILSNTKICSVYIQTKG